MSLQKTHTEKINSTNNKPTIEEFHKKDDDSMHHKALLKHNYTIQLSHKIYFLQEGKVFLVELNYIFIELYKITVKSWVYFFKKSEKNL